MIFAKKLTDWYLENKRELPWRNTRDPYRIWLSEIILQQTRVVQGLPYYYRFLEAYPQVSDLAAAPLEEVLKLWQGLGYYSRARNLHQAARFVAEECQGKFPATYEGLLQLKGVGKYTAAAMASFCYGHSIPVLDGNVFRVLSRIFGLEVPINSREGEGVFRDMAENLIDPEKAALYNQAIMEFGALHCTPQKPHCGTCPFSDTCFAYNQNRIRQLPVKIKKTKVRKRHFNYMVFLSDQQQTILHQRKEKGIWQGLYEFPLLETAEQKSDLAMDLEAYTSDKKPETILYNDVPIIHKLSHQHLYTHFWIIRCKELKPEGIPYQNLNKFPVPVLIEKFINTFDF